MRYSLFVLLLLPICLFGQYPTTGVKQRLGYQTTGDGLIYRGNGSPAFTPTGLMNAWTYIDTTAGTMYNYFGGSWHELETGGGVTMPLDSVSFNTSYTSQFGTGVMAYDPDNETVSVGIDGGATLQLGQELYYPLVINKSGALIKNGTPVMVDTATLTTGDHVRILPAKNNGIIPSNYIMGVTTTDIPNDSTGLVTWFGYVREIDEADIAQTGVTLSVGNILYISATEAGKYTNVAPSTPYHKSTIALVVRKPNSNNITLLVRPWLAPRLADLSDVNTSSVTGLSVLRYNSSTSTWDASATAGIVAADTAAMLAPYVNVADTAAMLNAYPRGSGTSWQVAYWNGTRSLTGSSLLTLNTTTKSLVFENNNIGINASIGGVTGTNNIAMGASTGSQLVTGNHNILLGNYAGGAVRTSNNIYLGYNAGENQYLGGNHISIGYNSSRKWSSGSAQNTVIGYGAGTNAVSTYVTGSNNIILGAESGATSGGSNNTIIGYNIDLSGNNSNRLTIKNLIFGTGASGTGTTAAGKMGILQPSPSYTLDINATDAIRLPVGTTAQRPTGASGVLRFNSDSTALEYHNGTSWRGIVNTWDASTGGGGGSSVWTQSGSKVYVTGALVGINTTNPTKMLEVDTSSNPVVPGGWGGNPDPKLVVNGIAGKSPQIAINTYGNTSAGFQFYANGIPTADFGYGQSGEIGFANRADARAVNFYTYGTRRQLSIYPTYASFRSPLYVGDSVLTGNTLKTPSSVLQVGGSFALNTPITVNASTYTVTYRDNWYICTYAGTTTFTLPAPSTCPGRILNFLNRANQTRLGSVAEIIPLAGGSATQTIVASTAGKWVTLVSDGTYWQTLQGN